MMQSDGEAMGLIGSQLTRREQMTGSRCRNRDAASEIMDQWRLAQKKRDSGKWEDSRSRENER